MLACKLNVYPVDYSLSKGAALRILKTDQYEKWFRKLKDAAVKARINARIRRIELSGELVGDWKPVGNKVIELRFDIGPGYRVYAHPRGSELVLLLVGGDKSSQQVDVSKAKDLLREWEAQNGR